MLVHVILVPVVMGLLAGLNPQFAAVVQVPVVVSNIETGVPSGGGKKT